MKKLILSSLVVLSVGISSTFAADKCFGSETKISSHLTSALKEAASDKFLPVVIEATPAAEAKLIDTLKRTLINFYLRRSITVPDGDFINLIQCTSSANQLFCFVTLPAEAILKISRPKYIISADLQISAKLALGHITQNPVPKASPRLADILTKLNPNESIRATILLTSKELAVVNAFQKKIEARVKIIEIYKNIFLVEGTAVELIAISTDSEVKGLGGE